MLVGTNNAVRVSALRQIGGFQDSITEDMATGLALHGARNAETSRRWTSVYTPDVVAVGRGPLLLQRLLQPAGPLVTRDRRGPRRPALAGGAPALAPRARSLLLLLCYYPTVAIAWVLGALNGLLYFSLGAGGVEVPAHLWLMLYLDAATLQVGLYFFNRRHNVSPHEEEGSTGMTGLLISALSAPIYAASLAAVVLRRATGFVITPKGDAGTPRRAGDLPQAPPLGPGLRHPPGPRLRARPRPRLDARLVAALAGGLPAAGGDLADRDGGPAAPASRGDQA